MKKVMIIGGGIAGLTCGAKLQKIGFDVTVYEKNNVVGGMCSSWKRGDYTVDNCIHWMTGTRPGTELNGLWRETGALSDEVKLYEKQTFYSSVYVGQKLSFYRDIEKSRAEFLALSPEDGKEINKLFDAVKAAEGMVMPAKKPFDKMSVGELLRLGKTMAPVIKGMSEYKNDDLVSLAARFKHPLIRQAIVDYMPARYKVNAFLVSYATVTSGNGDIPLGGSLKTTERIADKITSLGGKINTSCPVKQIIIEKGKATGVLLENGQTRFADYVVCAVDPYFAFHRLLPEKYMPAKLKKMYEKRDWFPVESSFQAAYSVKGVFPELSETTVVPCRELKVGTRIINRMSVQSYSYDPSFAPDGECVVQVSVPQTEKDFTFWSELAADKNAYSDKKRELAAEIQKRAEEAFPCIAGKTEVCDVWTPVSYASRCNAYRGAYMSFISAVNAKGSALLRDKVKGVKNLFLASQWVTGPGGLPSAASSGSFCAYRIIGKEKYKSNMSVSR